MTDFNYKEYSLQQLKNWIHDSISCEDITSHEIYDTIKKVVEEQYYYHKHHAGRCDELLALLNSGVAENKYQDYLNKTLSCDKDDSSPECRSAWNDFWEEDVIKEDKVVKWRLPVQLDGLTGDCYINLPDDLLEAADLKEGDTVKWIDNKDGTYTMVKTTEPLGMDEC